jgi:hypothetical protein
VSVSVVSWLVCVCGSSFRPGPRVVLVTGRRSHGLTYLRERSEIVLRRMCGWKWKLMVWYVLAQDDDERTLEEEELIAEEEGDKNANEVSDVMCHDSDA